MEKQKKNSCLAIMSDLGTWIWQLYRNNENTHTCSLVFVET
jgi:hypothetical protein